MTDDLFQSRGDQTNKQTIKQIAPFAMWERLTHIHDISMFKFTITLRQNQEREDKKR